ncbi:MAG: sigma 54-interacting transcriptional regulator [Kofleriaceae bacterium]
MPKSRHHESPTTAADASRDASSVFGTYVLVVGEDHMITRPLPVQGELVLGRDPDCGLALEHAKISRRHARLIVDRGTIQIEDIGSTNGIKVGGVRIARDEPVTLPVGDSVRIGPYTLIVLANRAAAETQDGAMRAAVIIRDPSVTGKTELLERIARHSVSVLIRGETGTGKEVLARTLHALSQRPGELVAINCAALTGSLLESDLFGHERGAFTGALKTKPGLLEVAGKGTVLLDEIGDLPLELQGKLLRALEARQVYRVGGVQPIDLHARVIAASHRSRPDLSARGEFREDLYFRLNGITLELLPLRERGAAIPTLAHEFLAEVARESGHTRARFTPAALAAMTTYGWPGNVRELRLVVARASLLAGDGPIDEQHVLLETPRVAEAHAPRAESVPSATSGSDTPDGFLAIARQHRGNASAIARVLSTSRSHVRRLASRFGVDLDSLRR